MPSVYRCFMSAKHFSSVQSLSCVRLFATPRAAPRRTSLSITNSWSLFKLMPIKSVMPSNHLILCHPLLLLPSVFPSIRVFSNESVLRIRWLNYWSFSISPSNEYSGLISFRMNWFDLLAVQGTLKSLLQHHSPKASILWPKHLILTRTLGDVDPIIIPVLQRQKVRPGKVKTVCGHTVRKGPELGIEPRPQTQSLGLHSPGV